jgi:DNA-binding NarL/FixJ family response regulator
MRTSSAEFNGSPQGAEREDSAPFHSDTRQTSTGTACACAQGIHKSNAPIVVLDARLLPRECLARLLSSELDVPVKCFSTTREWVESAPAASASVLVLCQYGCTNADALMEVELVAELARPNQRCHVIVVSDNEDPDHIVQMLGKNVRGYVPTSLSLNIVVQAVELVRAGGVFVPASSLITAHRVPDQIPVSKRLFTARQAAVVDALRRGKANKIIAYELNMRESTVKVHVRNIMKKLHATNRTEVAYLAGRLINGEEPAA